MIQSWCCHTILSHYTSCTAQNEIDQLRCVLIYGLLFAYADVLRWKGEMKWLDKMAYIVGYILRCLPTLHGLFISLNSWAVKQMIMTNWCGKYKKKRMERKMKRMEFQDFCHINHAKWLSFMRTSNVQQILKHPKRADWEYSIERNAVQI